MGPSRALSVFLVCIVVACVAEPPPPPLPSGGPDASWPTPADVDAQPPPPPPECSSPADCTDPTQPVCDEDHGICRGCALDRECASGACDFDTGLCYQPSAIVWVSPTGSSDDTCGDASDPCGSLAAAAPRVSAARPVVRMTPGGYPGQLVPASPVPMLVHGSGSLISVSTIADPVGVLASPGADLTLYDVAIGVFVVGGAPFAAVDVKAGARVALYRPMLHMSGAPATGIESAGELIIDGGQLTSTGLAISATGGSLVLNRSSITRSDGVYVGAPDFAITNNIITRTRRAAITLDSPIGSTKRLEFNTLVENGSAVEVGATKLAIRRCEMPGGQAFVPAYNVFSTSRVYAGPTGPRLVDGVPAFSVLDQVNLPAQADTNIYADAVLTTDGHLAGNSPARDRLTTAGALFDIDGDPRPLGAGYDLGADEYHP